jgi:hypothetical protein
VPFSGPLKGGVERTRAIATDGLVGESSTIQFDYFELRATAESGPRDDERSGRLHTVLAWAVGGTLLLSLVVGFVQLLRWLYMLVIG